MLNFTLLLILSVIILLSIAVIGTTLSYCFSLIHPWVSVSQPANGVPSIAPIMLIVSLLFGMNIILWSIFTEDEMLVYVKHYIGDEEYVRAKGMVNDRYMDEFKWFVYDGNKRTTKRLRYKISHGDFIVRSYTHSETCTVVLIPEKKSWFTDEIENKD